jgi:hypothetical protein
MLIDAHPQQRSRQKYACVRLRMACSFAMRLCAGRRETDILDWKGGWGPVSHAMRRLG